MRFSLLKSFSSFSLISMLLIKNSLALLVEKKDKLKARVKKKYINVSDNTSLKYTNDYQNLYL